MSETAIDVLTLYPLKLIRFSCLEPFDPPGVGSSL
jgi:hypothetical protein